MKLNELLQFIFDNFMKTAKKDQMPNGPPSAREMIAVMQEAILIEKQKIAQKEAKLAQLSAKIEDLQARLTALQNPPSESEDA